MVLESFYKELKEILQLKINKTSSDPLIRYVGIYCPCDSLRGLLGRFNNAEICEFDHHKSNIMGDPQIYVLCRAVFVSVSCLLCAVQYGSFFKTN